MKRTNTLSLLLFIFVCVSSGSVFADEPWKALFDGKTLDGWSQKGGRAIYAVEDGQIVGKTVLETPNSFLCTKQFYSDFILELEFKVDSKLNSGIQIRSNSFPEYNNGRVHGYQVEIDPSDRAFTGGIYDEARRGWLHPLKDNPTAQKAFKQDQWNTFRVEAIGNTIKTWLNDVPAAHLYDT
ncbi:MAG: 3-keto-disaccharide hydrolase, partial [Planctomycetota bacterium]